MRLTALWSSRGTDEDIHLGPALSVVVAKDVSSSNLTFKQTRGCKHMLRWIASFHLHLRVFATKTSNAFTFTITTIKRAAA